MVKADVLAALDAARSKYISGQELVRRFWEATVRGGYAGHGETYVNPDDILWWSLPRWMYS